MATKTVVISDIHMGTNEATNWYNNGIHEPYLAYILQWVIDNKTEVDELIILGDLFDFWTYPPDVKPPSAAEIIAANPGILGPDGLLNQVLNELEGRVSYLHGNHDITTTQEDLNAIGNSEYKVKLQNDIYVKDNVVYTHGHHFTLFNAPDISSNPPHPLPAGHFVTRAISFMLQQRGEAAFSEPGFGASNMGYGGLDGIIKEGWNVISKQSVTEALLADVQNATGISDDCLILLERDYGSIPFGEAKQIYANLFSDWVAEFNQGEDGEIRGVLFAYKAVYADYDGSYLGWFAQQLAFQYVADLVVMGHTHIPKKGLQGDIADYINTGFECVPSPDMSTDKMTFGVITTENGRAVSSEVMAVTLQNGQYQLSDDNPPKAIVLGGDGADYGCYITVENSSEENYTLVPNSIENNHGYFVVFPPTEIPAKSTVKFWIADIPNTPIGSDGEVKYVGQDSGKEIHLSFACTYLKISVFGSCESNCNSCGGTDFYSKSGSIHNDWGSKNEIAETDNPLFVKFEIN